MAMRIEQSTWEIGEEGEAQFDLFLYRSGLLHDQPFRMLSNLAFDAKREFPNLVHADHPLGDIDRVIIGPTGVWVWDVKNWSRMPSREECERRAHWTSLGAAYVYKVLEDAMQALKLDVKYGWAMMGLQPEIKYVSAMPLATPEEALEMMQQSPVAIFDEADLEALWTWAEARFKTVGAPVAQ